MRILLDTYDRAGAGSQAWIIQGAEKNQGTP